MKRKISSVTEEINKFRQNERKLENFSLPVKKVYYELEETHNNLLENDKRVLYFARLYTYSEEYVYKIGSTEYFSERMAQLNNEFNCSGKIIIIAACTIPSLKIEKLCHNKLSMYKINKNVKNPLKSKSREIYRINSTIYDEVIAFMEKYDNNIFESKHYIIEDDNSEKFSNFTKCEDNYNLELDEDGYITLDQYNNENDYWYEFYNSYI